MTSELNSKCCCCKCQLLHRLSQFHYSVLMVPQISALLILCLFITPLYIFFYHIQHTFSTKLNGYHYKYLIVHGSNTSLLMIHRISLISQCHTTPRISRIILGPHRGRTEPKDWDVSASTAQFQSQTGIGRK